MSASAQGLCEFIDASPSPFHVCVTVARRLSAAGFTELSERDEWPAEGRFFTGPRPLIKSLHRIFIRPESAARCVLSPAVARAYCRNVATVRAVFLPMG